MLFIAHMAAMMEGGGPCRKRLPGQCDQVPPQAGRNDCDRRQGRRLAIVRRGRIPFVQLIQTTSRMALLLLLACSVPATAAEPPRHLTDIPYASVDGRTLSLDLHLPGGVVQPPLVVFLHGGAWSSGDKKSYPEFLLAQGFAVASVEFRSSREARFPANVHDIKAAIRFLRAKQAEHGYRAARIALAGVSSGGHLAALVGTSDGAEELEGQVGTHLRESSAVQALISWYGASNLSTILAQSTEAGRGVREPALKLLLGALPEEVPELATLASPIAHVDAGDPPAILLHGDQDRQMPVNQTLELEGAYRKAALPVEMVIVHGAGHGGDAFYAGDAGSRVIEFLRRNIGR
jgi:acetyl esterase/lipase